MTSSSSRVTATEAARNFSDLLSRVRYRGETFEVLRGGEVIARLTSAFGPRRVTAKELLQSLARIASPDEAFSADLERVQAEQPTLPEDPWGS